MPKTKVEVYDKDQLIYPFIESDHVTFSNGMKITEMLDQSISMPKVTHEDSSFKVGVGDQDVSSAIVDSSVAEMTIKGQTYQNILPEPSLRNKMIGKSMQRLNEGYDNIEVVDGVSKSAILKGQTLVNLLNDDNIEQRQASNTSSICGYDKETRTFHFITNLSHPFNYSYISTYGLDKNGVVKYFKNDTDYTIMWYGEKIRDDDDSQTIIRIGASGNAYGNPGIYSKDANIKTGKMLYRTQTSYADSVIHPLGIKIVNTNNDIEYKLRFVILEGDYTNVDIPYFTGMKSVKMPVLTTTTSQNLSSVPFSFFEKTTDRKYGAWTIFEFDNLFSGKIILNKRPFNTIMYFDTKENRLNTGTTVVKDAQFIGFHNPSTNIENNNKGNLLELLKSGELDISLQENGKTNVYSYKKNDKTNILHTPEEVVLKGIGNVQDTLNCNTGEYVERIKEVVFDGSDDEGWYLVTPPPTDTTLIRFDIEGQIVNGVQIGLNKKLLCDKLPYIYLHTDSGSASITQECVSNHSKDPNKINVVIKKDRLPTPDVEGFKQWLQSNNLPIQYELTTPIIKTVDLLSSGNWEKVVYSGASNESWSYRQEYDTTNTYCFKNNRTLTNALLVNQTCPSFSDNLPINGLNTDKHSLHINGQPNIIMKIDKKLINEPTDINLRQYLQQNPVTVWYQTTTTQDNSIREMLSFANGHIQVSSEAENSLLPSVQYEIPTKNSYHMDLMKTNTLYTMKAKKVSGAFTIDGTSYNVNANGTFTSPSSMTDKLLVMSNKTNEEVMLLEGNVIDKTIPYFKGIKSAFEGEDKIEVLSTGKNLFDKNKVFYGKSTNGNGELIDSPQYVTSDLISVKPNTNYIVKHLVVVSMYDKNGSYIGGLNANHEQRTFTTPSNCSYIRIRNWGLLDTVELQKEVVEKTVLQEGGSIETYEPYKSNGTKIPLLSPLRSLPNGVCDELIINRMKKKATLIQRIKTVTLDGSSDERWTGYNDDSTRVTQGFYHNVSDLVIARANVNLYCDTLQPNINAIHSRDGRGVGTHNDGSNNRNIRLCLLKNELIPYGFSEPLKTNENVLRKWLQDNPTTVCYELATPVVTEVDLEGFPYIYKDGHIFLNSDIAPTTQITYSINQAQQIESANENLQRHEKEISRLQKLIAQYIQVEYESTLLSLKI